MGLPSAPNPLNRSLVGLSWLKPVVGASVMVWDPETEFGSVARQTSAPTVKSIAITSFSDFTYFPPVIRAEAGPIEVKVAFCGWPDLRGTLLEGNRHTATRGIYGARTSRVFLRRATEADPA